MRLVTSLDQILANIATLEAVRAGRRRADATAYADLIKRGTCFLPYLAQDGIAFAPSRFIGYVGNSFAKHAANTARDGRQTNGAINVVLGQAPLQDSTLEKEYERFCLQLGFTPSLTGTFGVARKYWVTADIRDRLDQIVEQEVIADLGLSATEKDQIVKARVGQGLFRDALMTLWKAKCCLTGCAIAPVLRASHIKPWRVSDNRERLDRFNGLLLTANIDVLFDRGLISFSDTGEILHTSRITGDQLRALGCNPDTKIPLSAHHGPYLAYHRAEIFDRRDQS